MLDNNTKLEWQQTFYSSTNSWFGAENLCNNLTYDEKSGWRLPTPQELLTILENGKSSPMVNETYFPNIKKQSFWSSAAYDGNSEYAWYLSFDTGTIATKKKSESNYILCVRGTVLPVGFFNSYEEDNGETIVHDTKTNLTWQKTYVSDKTWEEALSHCEQLNYGGYSNWRLPNKNELTSLVNYGTHFPASDFPNTPSESFWTSSTKVGSTSYAWSVKFDYGSVNSNTKSTKNRVRCVKNLCAKNERWNGSECKTIILTQKVPCIGLQDNTEWNRNNEITQTWDYDLEQWIPSNEGIYGETPINNTCVYKCKEHYTRIDSECVADTQLAECSAKPDNSLWNDDDAEGMFTQTWNGESWSPETYTSSYSTTAGVCKFKCYDEDEWNPNISKCVDFPYIDSKTKYMWSKKVSGKTFSAAVNYCNNLEENGYSDWHLPSISELRTLIQNYSYTQTGGRCKVTDSCLYSSYDDCYDSTYCSGVSSGSFSGAYSKLRDTTFLWSKSSVTEYPTSEAWYVNFINAAISHKSKSLTNSVRCVRKSE